MHRFGKLAAAGVICGTAALGTGAVAQASTPARALNANAHLVHVGLNPATCGTLPGKVSGEVNVHTNAKLSHSRINISVHGALAKTTYEVDVRCSTIGKIGTLTTNRAGSGTAHLSNVAYTFTAGSQFYIDISVPSTTIAISSAVGYGGYGDTFIAGPFTLGAKNK
ncbi:MAG: hypothetical protein ACYCST_12755 [Acidimicrobiales bacterium]